VVAIAPETLEAASRFAERNPLPYPLAVDPEHRVFDLYDVASKLASLGQRPALFVVDESGTVVFDQVGTQQWQIPANEAVLGLIAGRRGG